MRFTTKNSKARDDIKDLRIKCFLCGEQKPLEEMQFITRFKPPVLACKDCRRIW